MVPIPKLWGSRTGARLHLTRTSCISSEPRSWHTRCWPGDSPSPTTCRWRCRGSGLCPGCSSRCQHYLHPLCPPRDLAPALALARVRVQDQHLQIIAGLTVRPAVPSARGREGPQSKLTRRWAATSTDLGATTHGHPPLHPQTTRCRQRSGHSGSRAAFVLNVVSPAASPPPTPTPLPTLRGLLLGASPGARPACGGDAGINAGCLLSSCLSLPMYRYGRAQYAPPRTLRRAPWDSRSASRRASQALA